MFLLSEKRVSAVVSTMVICESATREWKNVLVYELSKYHAGFFFFFFEKKKRCNWYSKVSFRALCEVQRCNMDSSVKIRVMDTAGRIKSTLKNIIGYN